MKQKVVYVITKSNWGGAQRYVFDMATGLPTPSYDVLVAMGGSGPLKQRLDAAGIRTLEIPGLGRDVSFLKDIKSAFFLYRLFKREKPHVVHLNSSKIGALGALAGKMAKVPHIIFTLHGLALNEDRSPLSKLVIKAIYGLTVAWSTTTIAVSDALASQVKLLFPSLAQKIVTVHNGISAPAFFSKEDAQKKLLSGSAKASLTNNPSLFVIGTIGELHPIKGQIYLIRGFAAFLKEKFTGSSTDISHIKLVIIGEGEERAVLEKGITDLGMTENIILCGHVSEAARYLHAFDIFILPSLSEGLAYVIQEAGLAELPVIATRVGGLPEMIIDKKTGLLIDPLSPEDISTALSDLYKDPVLRAHLSHDLNRKISTEFTLKKMIAETEYLYKNS